jgi:hypothetical protein
MRPITLGFTLVLGVFVLVVGMGTATSRVFLKNIVPNMGPAPAFSNVAPAPPPPPTGANWYLSLTGSDANNGTTPAAAWATPNHAGLTCGDIIHVATGTYTTQFQSITQAVICPNSDNVVWLKCNTAFACKITGAPALKFQASYWGVQGFEVDNIGNVCFSATPAGSANIGYIAFANNIASGCTIAGIDTFNTGSFSVDNIAIIGNAAYNSANSTLCGSGMSVGSPRNDATANHRVYVAWNISWHNTVTRCLSSNATTNAVTAAGSAILHFASSQSAQGFEVIDVTTPSAIPANTEITSGAGVNLTMSANAAGPGVGSGDTITFSQNSDNTGLSFDTWGNYTGTGVVENNLFIGNGTSGLEALGTNGATCAPTVIRYNTIADNVIMPNAYGGSAASSEMALGGGLNDACMTVLYNVAKNIRSAPVCVGCRAKGMAFGPGDASPTTSTMDNNFLFSSVTNVGVTYWGNATSCLSPHTSPVGPFTNTDNAGCSGNSFTTDPVFVSETVPGAPSCAGHPTVADCMATAWANWKATNATAAAWGHTNAAPTDSNNNTPFLCNIYHAIPTGIVPSRC